MRKRPSANRIGAQNGSCMHTHTHPHRTSIKHIKDDKARCTSLTAQTLSLWRTHSWSTRARRTPCARQRRDTSADMITRENKGARSQIHSVGLHDWCAQSRLVDAGPTRTTRCRCCSGGSALSSVSGLFFDAWEVDVLPTREGVRAVTPTTVEACCAWRMLVRTLGRSSDGVQRVEREHGRA